MLKEMLEQVAKMAEAGARPQPLEVDPTKVLLLKKPDGSVEVFGDKPPRRAHTAMDLETVVACAEAGTEAVVWYTFEAVVCLLDDADRRERVTFTPIPSKQFTALEAMEKDPKAYGQRDLIFLLRTLFKPCLAMAGNLVENLRQIKFNVGTAGEATVQRGKSSVGKTFSAEISGTQELPEYVTLDVPIFDGSLAFVREKIECALEPDEATQTFRFFPLPGQCVSARTEAEAKILKAIADLANPDTFLVRHGKP